MRQPIRLVKTCCSSCYEVYILSNLDDNTLQNKELTMSNLDGIRVLSNLDDRLILIFAVEMTSNRTTYFLRRLPNLDGTTKGDCCAE